MSAQASSAGLTPTLGVDPSSPWKVRYWSVFIGQGFSLLGSAMTQFVLLWWITDTTGSVASLATAGLFALLPQAILGPLGGTFADRYNRRIIMIIADTVSAMCMAVLIALFLTGNIELWHIFTMMAVRSSMQAFQAPAAAASMAMLVPVSFLPRAAGLNQTLYGIMTIAAAPMGALAISIMPLGWALGIDVITAILGVSILLMVRIPQAARPAGDPAGIVREFRQGVQTVWSNRGLRLLYLLLAAMVITIMPAFTLVPLLVKEHLGGGAPQVALLEAIGGVGMIAGGAIVAIFAPRKYILWFILGFALSCLTLALTALAPSDWLLAAALMWAISGATFVMGNTPLTTLLQTTIPNHLQGRVLSLLSTVMALAAPVGLLMATPIGELIGVRWQFVVMGIAGTVVSLLGFLSRDIMALGTTPPEPSPEAGSPGPASSAQRP